MNQLINWGYYYSVSKPTKLASLKVLFFLQTIQVTIFILQWSLILFFHSKNKKKLILIAHRSHNTAQTITPEPSLVFLRITISNKNRPMRLIVSPWQKEPKGYRHPIMHFQTKGATEEWLLWVSKTHLFWRRVRELLEFRDNTPPGKSPMNETSTSFTWARTYEIRQQARLRLSVVWMTLFID